LLSGKSRVGCRDDNINLELHQFGRKIGEEIAMSLIRAVLNGEIPPLNPAQLVQPLPER
jgi:hypothetical protein